MTAGTSKSESPRTASGLSKAGTTAVRIVDLQKHYFLKGEKRSGPCAASLLKSPQATMWRSWAPRDREKVRS